MANFSAAIAVALEHLQQLSHLWLFGYNRGVGTTLFIPPSGAGQTGRPAWDTGGIDHFPFYIKARFPNDKRVFHFYVFRYIPDLADASV